MAHISTINSSLNTIRSKLGGGAIGLFWEKTKFTDKSKLLYSYNDGYLDTPSTSIDYINGLQEKSALLMKIYLMNIKNCAHQ